MSNLKREIKMEEQKRIKGFFIGILAGGAVGAIVALLYAPQSGRDFREDISVKKNKLVDDAGRYLKKKKDRSSEIVAEGKKKAERALEGAKKKLDAVKNKSERIIAGGKEKIAHESMLITDAIKAGIEAYRGERNSLSQLQN